MTVGEGPDILAKEGQAVEEVAHLGSRQVSVEAPIAGFAPAPLMQIMRREWPFGAFAEIRDIP
jgi:hypothetical protein